MQSEHEQILEDALEAVTMLRRDGAHLHSITNTVAQNFTANVLLSCGASVSMTVNEQEIEAFIAKAGALHVNLGTLDEARMSAILLAIKKARNQDIPVLLDPVMAHVSEQRCEFAKSLLERVDIVRANAQEISAVNAQANVSLCVVETGPVDRIISHTQELTIVNGDPIMARVIATGCALGALIAVLNAIAQTSLAASLAGLAWFSVAGELAAANSKGPGSFQAEFLDALHTITTDQIRQRINLK